MKHLFKRTKIVATVGPKTNSAEMIEALIKAGANGIRMNFSHGSHEERLKQIEWIRQASARDGDKPVAIIQDLQGPKIRLGNLDGDNDIAVHAGDELILEYGANYEWPTLPSQYNLAEKVQPNERVYLFDGKILSTVMEIVSSTAIKIRIENDGFLRSRKGINVPDTDFSGDIITEKDMDDIRFGASLDFDYVALSFVQTPDDIIKLRQILTELGSKAHIIAKIETQSAVSGDRLEEIVKASDGVMVARNDLSVEIGPEKVPTIQKRIISLCRKYGKISIVASQMMMSMCKEPFPTRAESSDIANAVMQGADAVMLSDETANGDYPIEAVLEMKKVILYTQENNNIPPVEQKILNGNLIRNSISLAAVRLAQELGAAGIVVGTNTGATALNIAAYRPNLILITISDNKDVAQKLGLCYASRNYLKPASEMASLDIARQVKTEGFFGDGPKTVILVGGSSLNQTGTTDRLVVVNLP